MPKVTYTADGSEFNNVEYTQVTSIENLNIVQM